MDESPNVQRYMLVRFTEKSVIWRKTLLIGNIIPLVILNNGRERFWPESGEFKEDNKLEILINSSIDYKAMTKIMVNRLKVVVGNIISPFQNGFVPGRNIHENIVIAHEMLHSMAKMRGNKGFFVIKVDLAKAYDRIDWRFIENVLNEMSLLYNMIRFIMECVTSVKTNVMWNGSRANYFKPRRGIRQGDPMSLYLFVLCMDKLSHLVTEEVDKGLWIPMKAGRNGPIISHLMFADDLLLFGQATHNTMNSVMNTLTKFCQMSGQQVNHTKTSIFYSKNVSRPIRDDLNALSSFTEASSLGNYLGVPALGRKPRSNDFYYLIDKVKNRLAGWKAKQLSMAGRITLAKSVIQAILIYPMMSMQVPRSCLDDIEKIQCSFIWGDTENVKKLHTIGRNTMILPKYLGGLDIRNLRIMNDACLMKLGWNLRTKKESLWTQVLWGKYVRDGNATTELVVKLTDSNLWKTIADLWPILIEHEYWAVGNGSSINFWTDKWLDDNTRIGDLVSVIPEEARGWKVSDVVTNEGEWNFDLISTTTPGDVINKLRSVVPPGLPIMIMS
ncbi:ribonuclease H [Trifolium pratense]|uniref:Ribonuclease H n=1 Tax=Trifolium pratense TaxID=57577 RepID=A0A2K3NFY4_TRIPR|nr:ribonuclease H [Trifolium pratense]